LRRVKNIEPDLIIKRQIRVLIK